MMRQTSALLVVASAVLSSVASSGPPPWEAASDYPLTVGVGWDVDYRTYDEIGELQLEAGFQGGQHLNASLRALDVEATEGIPCTLWLVDPALPEEQSVVVGPSNESCDLYRPQDLYLNSGDFPEGTTLLPGLRLVVDDPDAILERELELRVQLAGPGSQVGRAWARHEVAWMPDP